ncbi:short transient receptor potential channel 4-associated protein-like isoform X2 [Mercenaria mercenaria]|uniref:short transient receptor potential channel 4-associated protein-like isoform X2 n=1 Tax=Mercenaria mercenaria TaxID=6596 RepID=UPI00234F0C02|nr:short transient receptor potential channel 4-associated protein-like isoform X2 [Mercenaria mercenaria]
MFRTKPRNAPNKSSVFLSHEHWQYSGNGYKRLSQVPKHVLESVSDNDIPLTVTKLDEGSLDPDCDKEQFFQDLKVILGKLMNFESRRGQDESGADDEQNKYAVSLYKNGGVDVLVRILMFPSLFPPFTKYRRESDKDLRIKAMVLEILTKMTPTTVGEQVTTYLMEQEDVLSYMFTLLAHQKTFIIACQLIEDMLQSKKILLDLNKINNIQTLIQCLKDDQLANFCRILAVAISDLDIYDNKSSLFAQNKQKRSKGFVNVRDINQELLLAIPELLPRLVNLAVSKAYTPRFPGMVSELDCWMEWIENQMAEEPYDNPLDDEMEDFIGGITAPTTAESPMQKQQGLTITEELVQRVEVVYVLGLFLLGKHRKKVQRKLAELKLAPGLSELFDQFIWKCQVGRYTNRHRMRGHNAACECSPEVALKIQFLRLVHSFCDHSDYKHLLLSKSELSEVKRINAKAGSLQLPNLDNVNRQLMCRGNKGLLTKIVEVMKKEPTTSTFRFWLARAVESYLRGNTSYCDQVFLMRRGLLQHVASNIVEHEIRHKEILQSSFDLLGELVKFNIEAFRTFDNILTTSEKFDKFITTVNRNLVDSNMFIRSLILSLEHFRAEDEAISDYVRKDSRLLMYIGDFSRQLDYLYKLITIIDVQNLTQENVSCLNTTLVFLMFANRKHQLGRYLQALKDEKEGMLEVNGSVQFMTNFRDLLLFWQDHYLHKDKDCSALEKREELKYEDEDRSDNEDEKPTIVVLKEGDLTPEEAELALKDEKTVTQDYDCEESEPSDGKITFKKPTKRQGDTVNELNVSSSKKQKDEKKKKKSSSKEVKNSSLLSFDDEEEEET